MSDDEQTHMPEQTCAECGSSELGLEIAKLWDGNSYCVSCVRRVSDGLLTEARESQTLSGSPNLPILRIAGTWFLTSWAVWTAIWLILPLFSVLGARIEWTSSLLNWLILSAFGLPFCALFGVTYAGGFAAGHPRVSVSDGRVEVIRRGKTQSFPLAECEWYVGNLAHMTVDPSTVLLSTRSVNLVLPCLTDEKEPLTVAVAIEPERRRIWEAFLTLAKVPRRTEVAPATRLSPPMRLIATTVAAAFGFVGLAHAGMLLGEILTGVLPDPGLAYYVGTQFWIYGFLSAFFLVITSGRWSAKLRVPTSNSSKEQKAIERKTLMTCFAAATMFDVMPAVLDMKRAPLFNCLTIVTVSYFWVICFGIVQARVLSQYDLVFSVPLKSSDGESVSC